MATGRDLIWSIIKGGIFLENLSSPLNMNSFILHIYVIALLHNNLPTNNTNESTNDNL